jgi:hypothetical protein
MNFLSSESSLFSYVSNNDNNVTGFIIDCTVHKMDQRTTVIYGPLCGHGI